MSGLFQALTSVAAAAATQTTVRTLKRVGLLAVAGVFIIVGVCFGVAAGYQALTMSYGSLVAKLVVGGAFLVVGLIVLLVANWRNNRQQTQEVGTTSVALAFAMGLLGGLSRKR
jgi:undecaprenyl pyrophosphate phosphatase UppP